MQRSYNVSDFGADETGISDSTLAIQSAINRCRDDGGGTVVVDYPGVYIVSDAYNDTPFSTEFTNNLRLKSALVTYSNITIILGAGVTVRLAPQSNCTLIINNAADASTSSPDVNVGFDGTGAWDYGASTIFSDSFSTNVAGTVVTKVGAFAGYQWRSGDAFRYRLFDNSGWGQVTVTSKDSADQITLGTAVPAALRNQTGTVYATVNQQTQVFVAPYNIGYAVFMKNVRGLRIGTLYVRNNLKFGFMMVDVYDAEIDLVDGYSPTGGGDIFHMNGPCRNVKVGTVRGFSGDNIVGIISGEGIYGNGEAFTSVTYNAIAKTLTKGSAWSASLIPGTKIRLTSGDGVTAGQRQTATVVSGQGTTVLTLSATINATDGAINLAGHVEGLYSFLGNEGDIYDVTIGTIHARDDTGSFEPYRLSGPLGTTIGNVSVGVISGVVTNGSSAAFIDDAANGNLTGWIGRDLYIGEIRSFGTKATSAFTDRTSPTVTISAAGISSLKIGSLVHWNAIASTSGLVVNTGVTVGQIEIGSISNITAITHTGIAGLIVMTGSVTNLRIGTMKVLAGTNGAAMNISGASASNVEIGYIDFDGVDNTTCYGIIYQSTADGKVSVLGGSMKSNDVTAGTWNGYMFRHINAGTWTLDLNNIDFDGVYCIFQSNFQYAKTIITGTRLSYANIAQYVLMSTALVSDGGGSGLLRMRNEHFKCLGEHTYGTTVKGDRFDNISTNAGPLGSPATNWNTVTVGPVIYNGTAWEKFGRTL